MATDPKEKSNPDPAAQLMGALFQNAKGSNQLDHTGHFNNRKNKDWLSLLVRERERQTDRQTETERQRQTETDRQTDKKRERQTETETD